MTIASPGLQTGEWNTMCRAERIFNKPKNNKEIDLELVKFYKYRVFTPKQCRERMQLKLNTQ